MTTFQITFVWPDDDWTWIDVEANDFHQAMLIALDKLPSSCRVHRIEKLTYPSRRINEMIHEKLP